MVRAHAPVNAITEASSLPPERLRQGRRRAREAMAHNGSDHMLDGLKYWARRDHDADLVVVYE